MAKKALVTYQKLIPNLEFIAKLSRKQRKYFLSKAKTESLKSFVNFIYNICFEGIPITQDTVQKLRPFEDKIKKICTKKYSMKERRQMLITDDFFGKLINIMLPELHEIILADS